MTKKNIFITPSETGQQEIFETLLQTNDLRIERILTLQPYAKPGEWYDQPQDEWVLLLKGQAMLEFKNEGLIELLRGDYIFIPAHKIHRIRTTTMDQVCVWLAIHGNLK